MDTFCRTTPDFFPWHRSVFHDIICSHPHLLRQSKLRRGKQHGYPLVKLRFHGTLSKIFHKKCWIAHFYMLKLHFWRKNSPEHENIWQSLEDSRHERSFKYSREGWGLIEAKEYWIISVLSSIWNHCYYACHILYGGYPIIRQKVFEGVSSREWICMKILL